MELFFVSSLCLFFLLLLTLSLYFIFYNNKPSLPGPLPPGRTGWPLIGETLRYLSAGWKGHPEEFILDRMGKYSPIVFRSHLLGEPVAVFCGASGNKFLFSNENKLVQTWWPSSVQKLFESPSDTPEKERNITMRKMIQTVLKPEALQRYIGIMDQIAQSHFDSNWKNKDQVKVFPLCMDYTFLVATKLFLSIEDPTEVAKLLEPFKVLVTGLFSIPIDLPGTPFSKAIKASNKIRELLVAIIKQRKVDLAEGKASKTQDILSHMLVTSDENGKFMHECDIANVICTVLVGGHDTATSTCTFVVKYLAELPHIYDAVYKEQMEIAKSKMPGESLNWDDIQKMKYSWNVACEVLRLAPPLQGTFKEALTDFMYKGFSIPKGWKMYWSTYSTHKNPEFFPQPEKFDPSRFEGSGPAPYTFVPFGGGPRMCPGKDHARLEILVFIHNLVKRFRWKKINSSENILVDPFPVPANGLPVKLFPHME